MQEGEKKMQAYFDKNASKRDKWKRRNKFYHKKIENHFSFIIPEGSTVLELGCSTGDLLNSVKPKIGIGVDFSSNAVKIARKKYPHLEFHCQNATNFEYTGEINYIIISDLLSSAWDLQALFKQVRKLLNPRTKVIISNYNFIWNPILRTAEFFGLKEKQPHQNWLSVKDIENLLYLEDMELIKLERKLLLPKFIPIFNFMINRFLANLPLIRKLDLLEFLTVRAVVKEPQNYSVTIVVPARNERGNIENAILRIPSFGSNQEIIFIEGNSSDNTYEEMLRVQQKYTDRDIKVMKQTGKGKGNAVHEAFAEAKGEVLMILDADLTTPPQDLPKFY